MSETYEWRIAIGRQLIARQGQMFRAEHVYPWLEQLHAERSKVVVPPFTVYRLGRPMVDVQLVELLPAGPRIWWHVAADAADGTSVLVEDGKAIRVCSQAWVPVPEAIVNLGANIGGRS